MGRNRVGRSRLFLGIRAGRRRAVVARPSARSTPPLSGRARERGDAGVTLIELVIAFLVLMIVLVPVGKLLTNVLSQSTTARDKLTALSLAEKCLEKLNNTGPTLSDGVPETSVAITEGSHCFDTSPVTESTTKYTVHAEFTWETAQGSHPDLCTSSVTATLIEAHVWTTWGRTEKVTDTTLLDYPPPELPDDGFLAVEVNGTPASSPPADASGRAWSTRVQLVPVTIAGTDFSVTLYPSSYGCVFEEVPAPDTYTVTAKDPTIGGEAASPSWVSASRETSTASETVKSELGTTTHVTFRYDEGAIVDLHYPSTTATEGPVTCPGKGQIECVVFGQAPSSTTAPAEAPGDAEISVLDTTTKKWSVEPVTGAARLSALACAGTTQCVAVGYKETGTSYKGVSLSSATSSSPSFSPDTAVPSGVTTLSGITCPSSTRCYAWGLNSTGAVVLTGTVTSTSVTWASDTLGTTVPARVTAIACWSETHCYALGTKKSATTPAVLSLSTSIKWVADTLPTTPTYAPLTLTQLVCPAATKCYAVGTRASSRADVVSLSSTKVWKADTWKTTLEHSTKTTVTALSKIDCAVLTSGTVVCYAVGTRSSGGAIASLTGTTTWKQDTPKTAKTVTAITCLGVTSTTSVCLALGTSSTGTPALFWRPTTSTTTFTSETVPSSVTEIWAIDCASSSDCFAIGTTSTHAVVISGTTSWSLDSLPATPTPVSFSGLACGGTACTAPGATETAAVYFDGTTTGTTWSNATPTGAEGMYVGDPPIAVTSSSLTTTPVEVTVTSGTSGTSHTEALFPFSSGYHLAASECKPLPASVEVTTTPGATSTATIPMGLLSLSVVNKYGNPDTKVTVAATPSCTTKLQTPLTKYTSETTGPLGLSQVAVPYGTYEVKVTTHTTYKTVKVVVGATSVTETSGSAQSPSAPLAVTLT